jgi:cytochrome c peroxidase
MISLLALFACTGAPTPDPEVVDTAGPVDALGFTPLQRERLSHFGPPGAPPPDPTNRWADDPDAAALGQRLFFDRRFSSNGGVSCASCHNPRRGFGDAHPLSTALGVTGRHAPTVYNTAWNRWFFWDGRADSLWSQALGPIENPVEHGFDRVALGHVLDEDATLRARWVEVFGDLPDFRDRARFPDHARPVVDHPDDPAQVAWAAMSQADRDLVDETFARFGKAIAAYERRIVSRDAPFDRWIAAWQAGDEAAMDAALTPDARAGLGLFVGEASCHFCHNGPNLTNREFHNVGLAPAPNTDPDDAGRYDAIAKVLGDPFNGAGRWSDDPANGAEKLDRLRQSVEQLGAFKTPTLREVARTGPYFHGGNFANLTEVVRHYVNNDEIPAFGHAEELIDPIDLDDTQIAQVVAFLESLNGAPLPAELMGPPGE